MKLQIARSKSELISGFEHVLLIDGALDLTKFSNNECELILASNILDFVKFDQVENLVRTLISKLRLKGVVVIGGTDVRVFAKALLNGLITSAEAASMISDLSSMADSSWVRDILEQKYKLRIDSFKIDGVHYEISASRS